MPTSSNTINYTRFYINRLLDLASHHLAASRHAMAKEFCNKVLDIQPNNLQANYLLAQLAALDKDYIKTATLLLAIANTKPNAQEDAADFFELHTKEALLTQAAKQVKALAAEKPNLYEPWYYLAKIFLDLDNMDAFSQAAKRAKELAGNDHKRHHELADIYVKAHYHVNTEACLQEALRLKPENAGYYNKLGALLKSIGRADEAIELSGRAVQTADKQLPDFTHLNNHVMGFINSAKRSPEQIFAEHKYWGEQLCKTINRIKLANIERDPEKVLHIGYVSADCYTHPVVFFLESLLRVADSPSFRVFVYYSDKREDCMTEQIKQRCHGWRHIHNLPDEQVCQQILEDKIDILADLTGWFRCNRLKIFAAKPAPVQLSWLGYPHSTGLPTIDYRFTDAIADPPGMTEHLHTEKLYRLPDCFTSYNPVSNSPDPLPLPCLENGYITFVAYNNLSKTNDQLLAWWAEILKQVPDSRLMLKGKAFVRDFRFKEKWLKHFARLGVSADQIIFNDVQADINDHFKTLSSADIFLDSYPYNGTTTTCETLWMAVPVITLAGRSHIARVSASLLTCINAPELVANSPQEYISKAVELANDLERLKYYRSNLRKMMQQSPLLDLRGLTRKLEAAYRDIWQQYCAGKLDGES